MQIQLFEGMKVRSVWNEVEEQWYFVLIDIIEVLTGSSNPSQYLKDMRRRDPELNKGWGQIATPLVVPTEGGRQRINCANTHGILRLVQSVPSPKAEPFKQWLAQVGYERIQEIENPELAAQRSIELYRAKGYSDEWINTRLRSIEIRQKLTDEWQFRGVKEGKEYAILTAEIAKATFGINPTDHKNLKNIKSGNLRDNMTDLELIFTMLGEASTTEIAKTEDAQGFDENKEVAKQGGRIAGNARRELETKTGKKVVSAKNAKDLIAEQKRNKPLESASNERLGDASE